MTPLEWLAKHNPFTGEFNNKALDKMPPNHIILFAALLAAFVVVICAMFIQMDWANVASILGFFAVICFIVISARQEKN